MPNVFELIQQLCPDGVEYKRLGEVCRIQAGWAFPERFQGKNDGLFPFFKVSDMAHADNGIFMSQANNYVDSIDVLLLKCKIMSRGTIVFPKVGATIYTNKKRILATDAFYDNNLMGLVPSNTIHYKFIFYIMQSVELVMFANFSGAVPSIRASTIARYRIPVPPLPVQQEIVRILDAFDTYCNNMTAGLAGELEMRRKQFQYWREILINQQKDSTCFLGAFFTQVTGKAGSDFPKERLRVVSNTMGLVSKDEYGQRTMDSSEDLSNYKLVQPGQFVYNPRWLHVGSIAYNKEPFPVAVSPAYQVFSVSGIHPDYLMHLFRCNEFDRQRERYTEKGAGMKFTFDKFQHVSLPVPSMDVQIKIVEVLNKFDELEHELEQRRKQFSYYRDELLMFPERKEEA